MLIEGWMRLGAVALVAIAAVMFVLRPRRGKNLKSRGQPEAAHTEYSHVDQYLGANDHARHPDSGSGHGSD